MRWGQELGENQECPHHEKAETDGVQMKTSLAGGRKP